MWFNARSEMQKHDDIVASLWPTEDWTPTAPKQALPSKITQEYGEPFEARTSPRALP